MLDFLKAGIHKRDSGFCFIMRGLLIVFEGIDFCNKSILFSETKNFVSSHKNKFISISDDTEIGKQTSEILKTKLPSPEELCVLFSAARGQIIDIIVKYLDNGINVWLERYLLSTIAYQHYGDGVSLYTILQLHSQYSKNIFPDATIYFESTIEEFDKSRKYYQDHNEIRQNDCMEKRNLSYMKRVLDGYEKEIKIGRFTGAVIKLNRQTSELSSQLMSFIIANENYFF